MRITGPRGGGGGGGCVTRGTSTAATATGTADDVDVRLSLIKQKRLEAKAAIVLSVCEDIPMGAIAWYRIQNIDGGSTSSMMVIVSSAL